MNETTSKDGGPAFAHGGNDIEESQRGMSLLDFMAAHALAGMIASGGCGSPEANARASYRNAAAMLAEREARRG